MPPRDARSRLSGPSHHGAAPDSHSCCGHPEPSADLAHGILISEQLHDRPLGFDRWCKMVVAFLKMFCSRVKRPRICSNSPIREPSWPLWCSEVANTEAARVRNVFMQGYQPVGAGAVAYSASGLAPLVEGRVNSPANFPRYAGECHVPYHPRGFPGVTLLLADRDERPQEGMDGELAGLVETYSKIESAVCLRR